MPRRTPLRPSLVAAVLLLATACGGDQPRSAGDEVDPSEQVGPGGQVDPGQEDPPLGAVDPSTLDPCGGSDHPCTYAGVTPEVEARTEELSDLLLERLQSAADLDEAAAWLRTQDGVVSVATGPEAIRFRVKGGRGQWVFVQTAGTVATLSAPTMPKPPTGSAPNPVTPQGAGERQIKKALLLSPFRWQWEVEGANDGVDAIAKALQARDYRNQVTVWTERLDPADPKRTIGEIGLTAFTTWDDYDYVHVLTHGGLACNPQGHCMTAIMTPWTADLVASARAGAEYGGNSDLLSLWDRVGIETAKVQVDAPASRVPNVGPGQTMREDVPLTQQSLPPDQQSVRTMTGPFILLTSQFFVDTYQGGVDDAVIVISACSSGTDSDLLRAVQGDNTAVIGWRQTMSLGAAAAAGTLIAKTLVEVDETIEDDSGLTVEQAMDRIRDRIDELATAPPDDQACASPSDADTQARCAFASDAQVLSVINDEVADPVTGASLVVLGDDKIRAREIVYLVDDAGEELKDRGRLSLVGTAEDGSADSVVLRIRVDGLGPDDDASAVDLRAELDGREIDIEKGLEKEITTGVWETEYHLPLGRDALDGERVDIDIMAELPGGSGTVSFSPDGITRWDYEDLLLVGTELRYFGRLIAEVGAAEPEELPAGPMDWPKREADFEAAMNADAELLGHVMAEQMGVGAGPIARENLTDMMTAAFEGSLSRENRRSRRGGGPYFGRMETDVLDLSDMSQVWTGDPVQHSLSFSHQAAADRNSLSGSVSADSWAQLLDQDARSRTFALYFGGDSNGRCADDNSATRQGILGCGGEAEGLHVLAWVVETDEDMTVRVTLRADADGRGLATTVFVPAVVLNGRVPAAVPSSANNFQPLMATSVLSSMGSPQDLQAQLNERLAELSPAERQQAEAMMGGDLQQMMGNAMRMMGGMQGGTADGYVRLPGPPQGHESVTYYLMTVASFEMDPSNRDASGESGRDGQGWSAQGAASVAARLERVSGAGSGAPPELPGLEQVQAMMGVNR